MCVVPCLPLGSPQPSQVSVFSSRKKNLKKERKQACSLGQVSPSSHGSDDNRFVDAGELACTRPTVYSPH